MKPANRLFPVLALVASDHWLSCASEQSVAPTAPAPEMDPFE